MPRAQPFTSITGDDVIHPAGTVAELFERAREPRRLEFLPFDQTQLYVEPGLSIANGIATAFFGDKPGAPR